MRKGSRKRRGRPDAQTEPSARAADRPAADPPVRGSGRGQPDAGASASAVHPGVAGGRARRDGDPAAPATDPAVAGSHRAAADTSSAEFQSAEFQSAEFQSAGAQSAGARSFGTRSLTPGFLYADTVRVLSSWEAPDPGQEAVRLEFLRHLDEHPADGMWRACADGHITASTAVLDASRTRVLLTLHGKVKAWLQLGGHCEPGDVTLAGAALREATEESGIRGLRLLPDPVRLDRHPVRCLSRDTWHLDVQYAAVAPERARHVVSDESDDLRWFPVDDLPEPTDDVVRSLVARAVSVSG